MKLLLDEMFPAAIAEQLRARGHDVVAVLEQDGLPGMDDSDLLDWAHRDQHAVVTENVPDFIRLDRAWRDQGRDHHGLIFAKKRRGTGRRIVGSLVRDLDRFLTQHAQAHPRGVVAWV
ncbi:MAG: DUF5615 family PIN-like protein [Actinobacteria bacterium]|nr:DUF5615 family PIN-like protein [Actinomycetota bacterium]